MAPTLSVLVVMVVVVGLCSSGAVADFASDQAECGDKLVALATCLPFAEGSAKTPTPDCCSGLKAVVAKSPRCLCILIKDRDEPQLGFKIDLDNALRLPSICSSSASITDCPKYLNLSPNSPEAQVFKVNGTSSQGSSTASNVKGNSTSNGKAGGGIDVKKNGGSSAVHHQCWKGMRWLGVFGLVVFFIMDSF